MLNRIIVAALLCAAACPILAAQTKTVDDKTCHIPLPPARAAPISTIPP
ncbi:MAG TPA: hypothetical protein VMH00_04235 [Candidatus Limnocylindrales bacterium]|nr:hypothetical protein [Candidatus Limnocylindrales bacterium]